jgi:hypothetical protein
MRACNVTLVGAAAQAALARLSVDAGQQTSTIRIKRFSALSSDRRALYLPKRDHHLLRVRPDRIDEVANGTNPDSIWLEHPERNAFVYGSLNTAEGLEHFERLLVETQACSERSMCWFIAMAEALFPYVRENCPARFITVHIGPSQSGKTTGAQRFTLLQGLGDVKGDWSVAALANMPDPGLLVLDNKEQANFKQDLVDYGLFLATGAERGRSTQDGQLRKAPSGRPVCVITTIEGVNKTEFRKRCIYVQYGVAGNRLRRGAIEQEITKRRDEICSALTKVLQRYLAIREQERETPHPIPEFDEHFAELCYLLWAYADVSAKPSGWADTIIADWARIIGEHEDEDDSELEEPIWTVLKSAGLYDLGSVKSILYQGQPGKLYETECGTLLGALKYLRRDHVSLPSTPKGLSNRLNSTSFHSFVYLTPERAPDLLRRSANRRPIGFFVPNDDVTIAEPPTAIPSSSELAEAVPHIAPYDDDDDNDG